MSFVEPPESSQEMAENVDLAATYLKSLAHKGRLMILCHLTEGERSVGELEALLECRQSAVSQMLARLREDELVCTRREGKTIYYTLANENTRRMITLLHQMFCEDD